MALYSIPLKLTEIMEIPVRSIAMTVFPKMSKASIEGNKELVIKLFHQNVGGLTFLLIPILVVSFIFAEDLVLILGGEEYIETASVFRIFCFYGLLLPIDRFIGVTLDSINMPKQNFIKVIYMTISNIIGDAIAVFGFYYIFMALSVFTLITIGYTNPESVISSASMFTTIAILNMVAFITIVFTVIGIVIGGFYLKRELNIKFQHIFVGGILFVKDYLKGKT